MINPSSKDFAKLASHGNLVPVWTTVPADLLTPVSAYLRLTQKKSAATAKRTKRRESTHAYSFLLESVEGGETIARYTYLGADPILALRFWLDDPAGPKNAEGLIEITERGRRRELRGNLMSVARELFAQFRPVRPAELPPFTAGAVGYLGYDLITLREPVPLPADAGQTGGKTTERMPDATLMFCATVLVFDHVKHQITIVRNVQCPDHSSKAALAAAYRSAQAELERVERALEKPLHFPTASRSKRSSASPDFRSNVTRQRFLKQVSRAKDYIRAGDIFQVVLSQRFETKLDSHPFDVYRALRRVNPAPYLFYLSLGADAVLGSSPEMLVKLTGDDVEYRPIAGTRPRGKTPQEDALLERELLADEKERAEHVMLVDLGRNDVGRVSQYGSVQVSGLMFVERYSHVMHLVSSIRGKLRKGLDAWDALWACFPAGTLTGAPKVRAMQIISELEPTRRGVYGGAVLYFDLTGNLNSCIAIRTIVVRGGRAYVQVGAGVVADSVPEREFDETINKGKAMLKSIELARQSK